MTEEAHPDPHAKAADARAKNRTVKPRGKRVDTGAICGHDTTKGGLCKRTPGEGTDHPGVGPCKSHDQGWATMRADTKVERYARPLLAKLTGYDIDVNPMDGLLMCVRITAAEVAYFTERMAALGEDAMVQRPSITRTTVKQKGTEQERQVVRVEQEEELNLWMKARRASMRDHAHFCKMALDAGVDERIVRVQESVGEALAGAVRSILDDLRLTPEQREHVPDIVRKHLRLIGRGA